MQKRGLSDVVTTVLIILLSLVAVAIIGGVVIKNISKSAGKFDALSACQDLSAFKPISCNFNTDQVTVTRGADSAGALLGVKIIWMSNGNTVATVDAVPTTTLPNAYDTKILTGSTAVAYNQAKIAPILTGADGKPINCNPIDTVVTCVNAPTGPASQTFSYSSFTPAERPFHQSFFLIPPGPATLNALFTPPTQDYAELHLFRGGQDIVYTYDRISLGPPEVWAWIDGNGVNVGNSATLVPGETFNYYDSSYVLGHDLAGVPLTTLPAITTSAPTYGFFTVPLASASCMASEILTQAQAAGAGCTVVENYPESQTVTRCFGSGCTNPPSADFSLDYRSAYILTGCTSIRTFTPTC